jgi:hypothetical protein
MDRFLADADPARRKRSIDITRQMVQLRAKVHALSNQKVSPPWEDRTTTADRPASLGTLDFRSFARLVTFSAKRPSGT